MTIPRSKALQDLRNMFPDYDKKALNTLLRANGIHITFLHSYILLISLCIRKQF